MKLIGLSFLLSFTLSAKDITVAVIDTGLMDKVYKLKDNHLCATGHKDFTRTGLSDNIGHGTNVSGLIQYESKGTSYCQYIIKYTDTYNKNAINSYLEALTYAISLKPTIINLSLGATVANDIENTLIKKALDTGIKVIAAAGNEGKELGKDGYGYYPAQVDKRVIVIGATDYQGHKADFSNYGSIVDYWAIGVNRQGSFSDMEFSGTSQATASYTGTLVYLMNKGLIK